jgi:uncharacterized membrane protein YkvA (DUF1232 family)
MARFLIVVLAVAYILSPIDLIPDIPVVGWGDDLVAGLIGLKALMSPASRLPRT